MAWRDTLLELRDELAEVRSQRQQRAAAEEAELQQARRELSRLASSLGISQLLSEMNSTLLDGRGELETVVSWESGEDEPDDDGTDEQGQVDDENDDDEVVTTVLSWEEAGDREIAVEVALNEEGTAVVVNGVVIRPERDAMEQALVEAFRDELEL